MGQEIAGDAVSYSLQHIFQGFAGVRQAFVMAGVGHNGSSRAEGIRVDTLQNLFFQYLQLLLF